MNIFVLSRNVRLCAQQHCDQHVVKMPLETAQLLSTTLHSVDPSLWLALHREGLAYKPTHANHPCAIWTRECINNYLWLAALGLQLCTEYDYRFGRDKGRSHKSEPVIWALAQAKPSLPRRRCVTEFALAMPEEYRVPGDPVQSYRRYYMGEKLQFARWTKRERPEWAIGPS